jgi:hypothetical protein
MATRVHRPFKIIACNANGIKRQSHDLSKRLPDLLIDVALLSQTHLKSRERFFISNYNVCGMDRYPGRKGGTGVPVTKAISHNHVDVHSFVSVEETGVFGPPHYTTVGVLVATIKPSCRNNPDSYPVRHFTTFTDHKPIISCLRTDR